MYDVLNTIIGLGSFKAQCFKSADIFYLLMMITAKRMELNQISHYYLSSTWVSTGPAQYRVTMGIVIHSMKHQDVNPQST